MYLDNFTLIGVVAAVAIAALVVHLVASDSNDTQERDGSRADAHDDNLPVCP
ncbi:hypothetical protein [Thioalkalivibrio paradoxus]|uniref:Uncharacterized protein n=1 Tax=Thioalkalivibrio paradoxus ARh 1 TaxID=713585 RepID=W0DRQ9_9GAMM|nr:hypothetical protein [Thioalkalivibrio paradoxus]AHE99952.1 hypothetical protein THITH_04785 [Thioalkalivibrio paradoxus ARh 1]